MINNVNANTRQVAYKGNFLKNVIATAKDYAGGATVIASAAKGGLKKAAEVDPKYRKQAAALTQHSNDVLMGKIKPKILLDF